MDVMSSVSWSLDHACLTVRSLTAAVNSHGPMYGIQSASVGWMTGNHSAKLFTKQQSWTLADLLQLQFGFKLWFAVYVILIAIVL